MIKLYANIDKLQAAMKRSGMHKPADHLRDFCRGFSQVGGWAEFIDVGDGNGQADHQIKGKTLFTEILQEHNAKLNPQESWSILKTTPLVSTLCLEGVTTMVMSAI